jgi:hypothetical protein
MKKDTEKTKVIFRKFPDGEVIALFPEMPEHDYLIGSYMHVGQHGTASKGIVQSTKLASPEEYNDLFNELSGMGYNLKIVKKIMK